MTDDEREAIAAENTPVVDWQEAILTMIEAFEGLQKQVDQLRKQHDALAEVVMMQDKDAGLFQ